jgi:hypothetical protein
MLRWILAIWQKPMRYLVINAAVAKLPAEIGAIGLDENLDLAIAPKLYLTAKHSLSPLTASRYNHYHSCYYSAPGLGCTALLLSHTYLLFARIFLISLRPYSPISRQSG